MLYILVGILLLGLVYFLFGRNDVTLNKNFTYRRNITNMFTNPFKNSICGRKSMYCNDTLIRPFMFRNLSNQYVSNDNTTWNIEQLTDNTYQLNLSDRYCAYSNNGSLCLYENNQSNTISNMSHNVNEPECKKKACSIDSILETTEFDPVRSQFKIEHVDGGYSIITSDNSYVCFQDTKLVLSNTFSSNCVFQFK